MKFCNLIFLSYVTATLVACGGGGDSSAVAAPADVADKYVGTWIHCEITGTNTSIKNTLVFAKTAATSLSYTAQEQTYSASTVCAGTNASTSQIGNVKFAGTKVIAADTVDKIDVAIGMPVVGNDKDIALITGTTLKLGDDTVLDANGYPTVLDSAYIFTKQ